MKKEIFEYKMPTKMAKELLKGRSETEKRMSQKDFLVKFVNDNCGIKGTCINVIVN